MLDLNEWAYEGKLSGRRRTTAVSPRPCVRLYWATSSSSAPWAGSSGGTAIALWKDGGEESGLGGLMTTAMLADVSELVD